MDTTEDKWLSIDCVAGLDWGDDETPVEVRTVSGKTLRGALLIDAEWRDGDGEEFPIFVFEGLDGSRFKIWELSEWRRVTSD